MSTSVEVSCLGGTRSRAVYPNEGHSCKHNEGCGTPFLPALKDGVSWGFSYEEWHWAAQGPQGRPWPWGMQPDPASGNATGATPTPVDAFPSGASPFGSLDMAGNTWEWTAPEWDDGWHRWRLLRGGSYFVAQGSFWYAEGGACPNSAHLRFLLMGEGLNRCATVGFRCAMDDVLIGQGEAT